MQVTEVRSRDEGDGALIEVLFSHSARPGSSFIVRFPLATRELISADEEWGDETIEVATTVIWANIVEIAAVPNDYLPRGFGHGEVEVFAWT